MKVVILCGGMGTRIRDVSREVPKPMIPIGTNPILWHIMQSYSHAGYKEFVLCLGYRSDVVKEFFLNYTTNTRDVTLRLGRNSAVEIVESDQCEAEGWSVTLSETGLHTMTGGRIRHIERYVASDEYFMLTYGDGVSDVDIGALVKFHKSHGKLLTVTGVRPPGRFGELSVVNGTEVVAFNEKPQMSGGLISGGYFVCSRDVFRYLRDGDESLVFENAPLSRLAADGEVRVFEHSGFWHPMDTYRDYVYLNELWEKGRAPWKP
ncbi:MAG: glucose-1-phosphate cytidylyltransferase [Formivibrio sp.]|nr:glucose-1-phosphate cytidylyltransferase [Formivibrio sp.]